MDIHLDWTAVGILIVMFGQLIGFVIWLTRLNATLDYLSKANEEMKNIIVGLEHVYAKREDLKLVDWKVDGLGKRVDELKLIKP